MNKEKDKFIKRPDKIPPFLIRVRDFFGFGKIDLPTEPKINLELSLEKIKMGKPDEKEKNEIEKIKKEMKTKLQNLKIERMDDKEKNNDKKFLNIEKIENINLLKKEEKENKKLLIIKKEENNKMKNIIKKINEKIANIFTLKKDAKGVLGSSAPKLGGLRSFGAGSRSFMLGFVVLVFSFVVGFSSFVFDVSKAIAADTTTPTVDLTYTQDPVGVGTQTIRARYNEPTVGTPTISIDQPGTAGGDITNATMTTPLNSWTLQSAAAQNTWTSVTYGHGVFVAVSSDGTQATQVMTSPDGINWTSHSSASLSAWSSVAYGLVNGTTPTFVAVSTSGTGSVVMTSTNDGVSWTSQTASIVTNTWTSVTFGNGVFVAVSSKTGTYTNAMTSPDGAVWTTQSFASQATFQSVTYGNVDGVATFVAVAGSSASFISARSIDNGVTWVTNNLPFSKQWSSVTYGNGMFLAVSPFTSVNDMASSPTGVTWTARTSTGYWNFVAYGDGTFVAVPNSGSTSILTSQSGTSFISKTVPVGATWKSIAYGNGMFVAVSSDGTNRVMTSLSGYTYDYTVHQANAGTYQDGVANVSLSSVTDIATNPSANPTHNSFIINTAGPTVALTYSKNLAGLGTNTITATYSSAVTTAPYITINQPGTTDIVNVQMSGAGGGTTYTYPYTVVAANGSTYVDGVTTVSLSPVVSVSGGNVAAQPTGTTFTTETIKPNVVITYSSPEIKAGSVQTITATFSETMIGTPTISIDQQGSTDVVSQNMNGSGLVWTYPYTAVASDGNAYKDGLATVTLGNITDLAQNTLNYLPVTTFNINTNLPTVALSYNPTTALPGTETITATYNEPISATPTISIDQQGTTDISSQTMSPYLGWVPKTAASQSTWNAVTYGNGTYVAVGAAGAVMTSPDGTNWTSQTAAEANTWVSVTYGNGVFVAVSSDGTNKIMYSTNNGVTWTAKASPLSSYPLVQVAYGNNIFMAASNSNAGNKITTSTNGIDWINTSAWSNSYAPKGVVYGNGVWFAGTDLSGSGGVYATSIDNGVNWIVQGSAMPAGYLRSVTYGNNLYVAVGISSNIYTSPTGATWTNRTATGVWNYVTFNNGVFVALGASGKVATSSDGITWNVTTTSAANTWTGATYGNGNFVAVSSDLTNRAMVAPAGIFNYPYTVVTATGTVPGASTYVDGVATVTLSNATDLAGNVQASAPSSPTFTIDTAGTSVALTYSANPAKVGPLTITATYSRAPTTTPNIGIDQQGTTDVLLSSNIAMSGSGTVYTYSYTVVAANTTTYKDGTATVTLSATQDSIGNTVSAPTNPGLVIDTNAPTASITYSPNPVKAGTETVTATFSEQMLGTPTVNIDQQGSSDTTANMIKSAPTMKSRFLWGNGMNGLAYGNGMFVTVYGGQGIATSPDGINWTAKWTGIPSGSWMSIAFGNGKFVAVSQASTYYVMTSPDGINWTSQGGGLTGVWYSVTYGNGLFVAAEYNATSRVMTSPDGVAWTQRLTGLGANFAYSNTVTFGNNLFAVANLYGQIMTSPDGTTWIARTTGAVSSANSLKTITYGGGQFMAVSGASSVIWTSSNGITWASQTGQLTGAVSVAYGDGLYTAVNSTHTANNIETSPDGITWTLGTVALGSTTTINTVGYFAGTWVMLGYGEIASSSPDYYYNYSVHADDGNLYKDGLATVSFPTVTDLAGNSLVVVNNDKFRIDTTAPVPTLTYTANPSGAGTNTITATYSETVKDFPAISIDQQGNASGDISNASMANIWTDTAQTGLTAAANYTFRVAYGNGIYVATRYNTGTGNGALYSSPDGVTWTSRSTLAATNVVFGNNIFMVVNENGAVMTSSNGTSWTTATSLTSGWSGSGNAATLLYVNLNNVPTFVAIGFQGSAYPGRIAFSTNNGSTWTYPTQPNGTGWYNGIAYGNGAFVISSSGNTGGSIYSTDLITWTSIGGANYYSVAFGNGTFVMSGTSGTIRTSTDGYAWTSQTSDGAGTWNSIVYNNGYFVVADKYTGKVMFSKDNGVTWTTDSSIPAYAWVANAANGKLIFTSSQASVKVYTSSYNSFSYPYTVHVESLPTYKDGTATVTLSTTTDAAGNQATAPDPASFEIYTSKPNVALTYSKPVAGVGTQTITATYSANVTSAPNINIVETGTYVMTPVAMSGSGKVFTYNYTVSAANAGTHKDGLATVTLSPVQDAVGNTANAPTNTTFTIETVPPTAAITYSPSRPLKTGDVVTITATFNEPMADAPVPKIAISGSNTLSSTNMTKTDTTHYFYNYTVGAGNGPATVALSTGTDLPGNIITSAPTSGATFSIDNISPTTGTITTLCSVAGNGCTTLGQAANPQEAYQVQAIAGTGADNIAVGAVEVSIQDSGTTKYYTGTSFTSDTEVYLPATGTTTWSFNSSAVPLEINHTYVINSKISDTALNTQIVSKNFKFTNSPPTVTKVTATEASSGVVTLSYDVSDFESAQTTNSLFYGIAETLSGNITTISTSLTVSSGTHFPSAGTIMIDNEIISYTTKTGNILSGLTRGALSTTAAAHTTGANIYAQATSATGTGIGQSAKGTGKEISWTARTDANFESGTGVIRVVANDGSSGSMIGYLDSAPFILDAQKPQATVTFDAGVAGVTGSATITIPMPTDISTVEYKITDDALSQTSPTNTGWVAMSGSTTIPWTFDQDVEVKTIKYQYRDSYGNITDEVSTSTPESISASSFLVQDTSNITIPLYDMYIGWKTASATGFASYKLEYATSSDNSTFSAYAPVSLTPITDVTTNYYVHRNLDPGLFYRYRLGVVGTNGNTSIRAGTFTTAKPDGVQNYGEGGGGSVATAPKVENVLPTQDIDGNVSIAYLLTDTSSSKKINASYQARVFYNTGITLVSATPLVGDTLKISNTSKLNNSGYVQINNEVIKYTAKNNGTNTLSGLTRGTWPTAARATRQNTNFFAGTQVWVMATNITPTANLTNTTISFAGGQAETVVWNTVGEVNLAGSNYTNVNVRVLVHDNQDSGSGPISSQNDFSENGILDVLSLAAPTIGFETTESEAPQATTPAVININLSRAYPVNTSVAYTVSGTSTAVGGGVDYTLSNGTVTILAGETSGSLSIPIVDHHNSRANKTIVITLSSPTVATLGTNTVHTYTIVNHGSDFTAPVITLIGNNPLHVWSTQAFVDPGATALDDTNGDLTSSITVTGTINTSVPNNTPQILTYSATDASGNTGTATRSVVVDDIANITYDITASAGAHGTISPIGVTSVLNHTNKTFTISPDANYEIATLTVDGSSVAVASSYTFTSVTTTHTIVVTFVFTDPAIPSVNITYSKNPAGVGTNTITATYTEAVTTTPNISINQPGTTDISNVAMTAPGSVWTGRAVQTANNWSSVAYGNGTFVAVTSAAASVSNMVMTSPDGINWTNRTASAQNAWVSVTYGNGVFVAVANVGGTAANRIMRSIDNGVTWTNQVAPIANTWQSVTYGNGVFVAVATSGGTADNRIMRSIDNGITWTSQSAPVANEWQSVTYGNGIFVAISFTTAPVENRVIRSTDNGVTWTAHSAAAVPYWISVTYGNGMFVAVSYSSVTPSNMIMTSSDGITWTSHASPINLNWYSIAYGNGTFIAVAYSGGTGTNRVMTSPDGINWTTRTTPMANNWTGATYGNGLFVIISQNSGTADTIATSPANYTYDYTVQKANGGAYIDGNAVVSLSSVVDLDGNTARTPTNNNFTIETNGPDVALSYSANIGKLGANTITATYSEPITGTPTISVDQQGSSDIYNAPMQGSGAVWTYPYTVMAPTGTTYKDGLATISLSTVTNAAGKVANGPTNNTFTIDGTVPTAAITYSFTNNRTNAGSKTITATFSEAIVGTPMISIDQQGSTDLVPTPMNGSNLVWTYPYTVNQANASTYVDGAATVSITGVTDAKTNALAAPTNATFIIDTTPASVALSYSVTPASVGTETITATYNEGISSTPSIAIDQAGGPAGDLAATPMTPPASVWTSRSAPVSNNWKSLAYGNGIFVVLSYNTGTSSDKVMTSPDGINWTSRSAPTANNWTSVTYGNGLFVAVAYSGTAADKVMTSLNGINWTSRSAPTANNWYSVTYGNGLFVAVAYDTGTAADKVMTSLNGINWTSRSAPTGNNWTSVTYGNGTFVAVAFDTGTAADKIMTSSDGINWTSRSAPTAYYWSYVGYGNGKFIAVAQLFGTAADKIITSPAGYTYDYTVHAPDADHSDGPANVTLTYTNKTDLVGNTINEPSNASFLIDNSEPYVDLTYEKNIAKTGVNKITATYSKAVLETPNITITQQGSATDTHAMTKVDGRIYTYDYTVVTANNGTYKDGQANVTLSLVHDFVNNSLVARNPTHPTFTIDTTAPVGSISYSPSRPVKNGDTLTITSTFTEAMADAPVPQIAITGSNTLTATNMVKTDPTHYTYTHTVGGGNGSSSVNLSAGTDVATNIVTSTPSAGTTFSVDNNAPTNTTITAICSTAGNGCTTEGALATPQETNSLQSIKGTTSDDIAVGGVEVSLKDTVTNKYYTGTSFTSDTEVYLPATGTTTWSFNSSTAPLEIGTIYNVNVKASDTALNTQIVPTQFKFTNSPPTVTNVTASQAIGTGVVTVNYDVTDVESTQTTNYLFYGVSQSLNGNITNSDTTLTVTNGTAFPSSGTVMIDNEIISYTTKTGKVLSGLTRGALNTTPFAHLSTASVFIKATTATGNVGTQENKGTGKTITWTPGGDANYESATGVIKVVANDGSSGSAIGSMNSATFNFDAKAPTSNVTFDAGVAGVTNSGLVTIPMPTDISTVEYMLSDSATTQTNPISTAWTSITSSTTAPWSFDSDIEVKTLKYKFRDAYGNVSTEIASATQSPVPPVSFIVQDTSNIISTPAVYELYLGWQSAPAEGFGSYRLEQATSNNNITYSAFTPIVDASFSNVATNYSIRRGLSSDTFYRFRLAVTGSNGNTSVRSNAYLTAKADGIQNYSEGGGGSVAAASKVENVVATQNEDKSVTVNYKLTDTSYSKKTNASYEAYLFYNTGLTIPGGALNGDTLKISNTSKLNNSGYVQVNNEVIKYTGKTSTTITGITRGTWPTNVSTGRVTRQNTTFFTGTPVWVMAVNAIPNSITNTTISSTGQDGTITWDTYNETGLAGTNYPNLNVRVLVHDNQDSLSGPLSTQNDFSEDGVVAVDLSAPTVSFDVASASNLESVTPVAVNIILSRAYPLDTTVTYTVTGTATGAGVDYTFASGTETFTAGQTTKAISIPIVNDTLKETDETIIITLSSPVNATLGTNPVYTYTIVNDDVGSSVEFDTASSSGLESVASVNIPIKIAEVSGADTKVDYTVTGTATGTGTDYTLVNGTATIPAGQLTANITVAIVNDTLKEIDETIILTLSNPVNATLGTNTVHTYTIIDDDTYPIIGFTNIVGQSKDNVTPVNIPVSISFTYEENVTVAYAVTGGTALSGTNYTLANGTLTIPKGQNSANISLVVIPDNTSTINKTVIVTLSTPVNGIIDTKGVYTHTILGNKINTTNLSNSAIKSTSAIISWTTADFTDSVVDYGTVAPTSETVGNYTLNKAKTAKVLEHSIYLGGLTPATKYYYKTTSTNLAGDTTVSESDFTTTAGPVISNVLVNTISDTGAVVTWTTNIPTNSRVNYSTSATLANPSVRGSVDLVTSHSVVLTGLSSAKKYYYYVDGVDVDSNIGEDANGGDYYNFTTLADQTPPVITAIAVPVITNTAAAITWTTDEPATSQVFFSTTPGDLAPRASVMDATKTIYHVVTLSSGTNDTLGAPNALVENTTYYYTVSSADAANNLANSTPEKTFVTVPTNPTEVVVVNTNTSNNPLNNNVSMFIPDVTAPVITGLKISDISAFEASVSFSTDEETLSFAEYGKDKKYGDNSANNIWSKDHVIKLRGLKFGTDYHVKVTAVDHAGNASSTEDKVFKTKFFSENPNDLTKIDNIEQFQSEIESTIESILPALIPPFIEEPKVIDITENSATITYRTNIKAFPVVGYVEDSAYDATKENPYLIETSDTTAKTLKHELQLLNLRSNMLYHLQARAFSLPQVVGKSEEITFTTKASKIQGSISQKKKDSFIVSWTTDEPTTSIVEYKNLKTGEIARMIDSVNKTTTHSMKVENLTPGITYEVGISGVNAKGNVVESDKALKVTTLVDVTPPVINSFKVESSLVAGRTDRSQSIVSWKTDEPSTSIVYYEEGSGSPDKPLANKQQDTSILVTNHVIILSTLKPGTIYRFQIASTDDAGNRAVLPIRTIITPRQNESIVDVIFKNFDSTFNFLKNVK